jgi:hypothetical protein
MAEIRELRFTDVVGGVRVEGLVAAWRRGGEGERAKGGGRQAHDHLISTLPVRNANFSEMPLFEEGYKPATQVCSPGSGA